MAKKRRLRVLERRLKTAASYSVAKLYIFAFRSMERFVIGHAQEFSHLSIFSDVDGHHSAQLTVFLRVWRYLHNIVTYLRTYLTVWASCPSECLA